MHISFPFNSLNIYERIKFRFCICICTKNVSLGIIDGQTNGRLMALLNVQKIGFWPVVPLLFGIAM